MNIPYFHVKVILPTHHGPISLGPTIVRARCAPLSPASRFPVSVVPVFQHSNCERSELTWLSQGALTMVPNSELSGDVESILQI